MIWEIFPNSSSLVNQSQASRNSSLSPLWTEQETHSPSLRQCKSRYPLSDLPATGRGKRKEAQKYIMLTNECDCKHRGALNPLPTGILGWSCLQDSFIPNWGQPCQNEPDSQASAGRQRLWDLVLLSPHNPTWHGCHIESQEAAVRLPWWGKVTCSKLRGRSGVCTSENTGEMRNKLQRGEASAGRWGMALLETGPQVHQW